MMKEGDKMISNQILQNTLDGLKGISRTDFCVTLLRNRHGGQGAGHYFCRKRMR